MKSFSFLVRLYSTKIFFALIGPFRKAYWYLVRPRRRGAKCVATYKNEVVLVKLNYLHNRWTFPGGGVRRGESFEAGALRELKEEAGIVARSATKFGEYLNESEYKRDSIEVFHTKLSERQTPVADGIEIAEAGWFALDHLPVDRVVRVDFILNLLPRNE